MNVARPRRGMSQETHAPHLRGASKWDRQALSVGYLTAAGAGFALFLAGSLLLAATLPYHDWDSFAFGDWSRRIAHGGSLDPLTAGQAGAGRPLFYAVQGSLWHLTGVSFTAGRLLSLGFAVVLLASLAALARLLPGDRDLDLVRMCVVVLCMLAVPAFTGETLSGKSDVPAAAMTALAMAFALSRRETHIAAAALALASFLAVLTKPTVVVPLAGLGAWLALERSRPLRVRLRWGAGPVALGLILGLVYDLVMAVRFDTGLIAFLRTGTAEGIWAQRAADARWDAVLRLDVLGAGLRLPLAFVLLYCLLRAVGAAHRGAAVAAWLGGVTWSIVGPIAADVPGGAFPDAYTTFALVGFAALFAGVVAAPDDLAPRRSVLVCLGAIGVPPLVLWFGWTAYASRLASATWPGLILLIGICACAGIGAFKRLDVGFALAPIAVFAVAAWLGLHSLDGLIGEQWAEYRSVGFQVVRDRARTMNIVLPSIQSAIATAEPYLRASRRLTVSDPQFSWFVSGDVTTTIPLRCRDVAGYDVFILLTSDESQYEARARGGLATPEEWARCTSPRLTQLSDGSNGYVVFAVRG